jgi:hypothetical protein
VAASFQRRWLSSVLCGATRRKVIRAFFVFFRTIWSEAKFAADSACFRLRSILERKWIGKFVVSLQLAKHYKVAGSNLFGRKRPCRRKHYLMVTSALNGFARIRKFQVNQLYSV